AFGDYAEDGSTAVCTDIVINGKTTCVVSAARRPGKRLAPSKLSISERAIELIVLCEVTSKARYEKSLTRPIWPRLQSGITIGIGYDLGYVAEDVFRAEWKNYLHPFVVDTLAKVTGLRGNDAKAQLPSCQNIKIGW